MNLEGEKPMRYFCSLEKQMKKTNLLDWLMIKDEEEVEVAWAINKSFKQE